VIARLRARHRRAWLALALVAPVVLAAGLAGRRGEAVTDSATLVALGAAGAPEGRVFDRQLLEDTPDQRVERRVRWTWSESTDPRSTLLRIEPAWKIQGLEPLLYWVLDGVTVASLQDVRLHSDYASNSFASIGLPEQVCLLGAWPARGTRTLRVPVELARSGGWICLYDLTASQIIVAGRLPAAGDDP
jgi:hypothetical protein